MPLTTILAVFKLFTSVQLDPSHNSVSFFGLGEPGVISPPKPRAEVLLAPAAPIPRLAKFKSATSVQLVPFQLSVIVTLQM